MHKNHNLHFVKHKTLNNRGVKNHNLVFQKHKLMFLPLALTILTLFSAYFLARTPLKTYADVISEVAINVGDTCSMEGIIESGKEHTITLSTGTYQSDIGETKLTVVCNDNQGFSIYAIGYSGVSSDLYNNTGLLGNNYMIGVATGNKISTDVFTDPPLSDNSLWSMKLSKDETSYFPENLTILNGFNNYSAIPSSYIKVANYTPKTGDTSSSAAIVKTTYAANVSTTETPDTYIGQVKYTMVHPGSVDPSHNIVTFDDAFQLAGKIRAENSSHFAMQDMNAVICSRVSAFQTSELIDVRDNNTYTVAKINGDCWMTENLAFTGATMDSATSNIASIYTPESPYTVSMINGENSGYFSLDSADSSYTDHCDNINGYNYSCIKDSGDKSAGVWYNYVAASAGTITTASNVDESIYSVCPAGWHLPSGPAYDSSSEFYGLYQSTTIRWVSNSYLDAFKDAPAGLYLKGSLIQTMQGFWWTATAIADGTQSRYNFYSNGLNLFAGGGNNRHYGYSVRCVANNTMQNFSHEDAANLVINEIVQLRDARDDNIYEVKKMPDGNVWMINNLRLAKGVALTNELSNVNSDGYTTPTAELANVSGALASGQETCSDDLEQGCWYNYCAATAGTYCSSASGVAEYDICPAGWQLPRQADTLSVKTYPTHFNIVMAGNYENGNHRNEDLVGTWWSTFYLGNNYQAALSGHSGQLAYSYSGGYRTAGNSIRCIYGNS